MKKYNISNEFKYLMNFHSDISTHKKIKAARRIERLSRLFIPKPKGNVKAKKLKISGYKNDLIDLYMYSPPNISAGSPCILYIHGGGFVLGNARNSRHLSFYAKQLSCIVFSVEYRLAPEFPFPYAPNDCFEALEFIIDNNETLGIDKNNIAIMGESAGAAIASSVTQMARDNDITLKYQVLLIPVTSNKCDTQSMIDFYDAHVWNYQNSIDMWRYYLNDNYDNPPKYAVPIDGDLYGLPPCYLETAEFDPLVDEGIAYAKALQSSGVKVALIETKGTMHGFDNAPFMGPIIKKQLAMRIAALKDAFESKF
jgi:acetyl esterase